MAYDPISSEQSAVYREMLRRGLRHRRVRPREVWIGRPARAALVLTAVSGLVAAAVLSGLVSLAPVVRIRDLRIRIDGPGTVSAEQVVERIALPEGATFTSFDWQAAVERVRALPRVRWVRLAYGWFHVLDVQVEERRAAALILDGEGNACEVSSDGVILAPVAATLPDLPLLGWPHASRPGIGERLALDGASELLQLLADLEVEQPRLWQGISEARLLADGGYEIYWNDIPTVVWGRGEISPLRRSAWAGVMDDLRRRGDLDAVVDLRLRGQILVRLPEDGGEVQTAG